MVDDCTRVSWVYLLKQKSDVRSVFSIFHAMVQNQLGVKIKRFCSDNATDYFNQILSSIHDLHVFTHLNKMGWQSGKWTHQDTTRALLFHNFIPKFY